MASSKGEVMTEEEKLIEEMLRILLVSLNTLHEKDSLNGGARIMLLQMTRATLSKNQQVMEGAE